MYEIEYSPQAVEDLKWFKKHEQNEILNAIDSQIRYEPTVVTRNRKRLRPNDTAEWELRAGSFRALYDVDEQARIVEIRRVGEKRGSAIFFGGKKGELG